LGVKSDLLDYLWMKCSGAKLTTQLTTNGTLGGQAGTSTF
jgi:hypothetical protein